MKFHRLERNEHASNRRTVLKKTKQNKKKNPNTIVNRPHKKIMMREPQEGE